MERFNKQKHLSSELKGAIIGLHKQGIPLTRIANQLNISKRTVIRWIKWYETENDIGRKARNQFHSKLTKDEQEEIINYVNKNSITNATKIKSDLKLQCHPITIRRTLKNNGIYCRRAAVKQDLFPFYMEARMGFALEHLTKSKEFWRNVVYSDEKTFSSAGMYDKFVYRKKGTRFENKNIIKSKKSGRVDVCL